MSVTVNNSPIQDYVHPDDHTLLTIIITLLLLLLPSLPCKYHFLCVTSYSLCHKLLFQSPHSLPGPQKNTHNSINNEKKIGVAIPVNQLRLLYVHTVP